MIMTRSIKKIGMIIFLTGLIIAGSGMSVFASQAGNHPSLAISDNGAFVEVHLCGGTGTNNIWFNLGQMQFYASGYGQNTGMWGLIQNDKIPAQAYNGDQGSWTSVAMTDNYVVVLFPANENGEIWCVSGEIEYQDAPDYWQYNTMPKSINWTSQKCLVRAPNPLPNIFGPVLIDVYADASTDNPQFMLKYLQYAQTLMPSTGDCYGGYLIQNALYQYQQWSLSDLKGDTVRTTAPGDLISSEMNYLSSSLRIHQADRIIALTGQPKMARAMPVNGAI